MKLPLKLATLLLGVVSAITGAGLLAATIGVGIVWLMRS